MRIAILTRVKTSQIASHSVNLLDVPSEYKSSILLDVDALIASVMRSIRFVKAFIVNHSPAFLTHQAAFPAHLCGWMIEQCYRHTVLHLLSLGQAAHLAPYLISCLQCVLSQQESSFSDVSLYSPLYRNASHRERAHRLLPMRPLLILSHSMVVNCLCLVIEN